MAWHDDMDNVYKWHEEARKRTILERVLKADNRPADVWDDKSYQALYSTFVEENKSMEGYDSGQDMLSEFVAWLRGAELEPVGEGQRFFAEITKSYGSVTVTFGFGAYFDVLAHQAPGAYRYCIHMVNEQFARYEKNGLAQTKPVRQHDNATSNDNVVEFVSDTIEVEIKEGKRYYKIKGAQYSKFGVRVWPEVLDQAGIEHEDFKTGSNHFVRECAALLQDGKVRKVVAIK